MTGLGGRPILRLEDPPLVRGQGHFTADLPSRFRARFVRSAVAAGRIAGITPPDGATVFTVADMIGVKPIRPMLHKFGYVPIEQPVLADGLVRYVGDPVAVVVADSDAEAEDIADRVEVEIVAVPLVTSASDAVAPGAPLVRGEVPGNVVVEAAIETDGHRAANTRAHRVIACAVRSNRQNASPLEPRAAHAVFDPATGRVTLTCTTQTPHMMRTIIADLLGMREADLRVIAPDVGGGFGQKMSLAPEFVVLVWLARHLRASVAWTEDRRENLMASFHARDMYLSVTGAFDPDAKLVALTGDVLANVGAYAPYPNTAAVEPLMSLAELPGPYDVASTPAGCAVR